MKISILMSLLLRELFGKCDYLTYYYAMQTLSDPNVKYSIVYNEGRTLIKSIYSSKIYDRYKSLMMNNLFACELFSLGYSFEKIFKNLEFMIISKNIGNAERFYKSIYFLENLKTVVVVQPDDDRIFNVLRTLPFGLKNLVLENINPKNVKHLDNLPTGLESVIFIHLLTNYEKTKEIFLNMKLPFDCEVKHLVKKNYDTTIVHDYEKLLKKNI
jgi:hypothetical protein